MHLLDLLEVGLIDAQWWATSRGAGRPAARVDRPSGRLTLFSHRLPVGAQLNCRPNMRMREPQIPPSTMYRLAVLFGRRARFHFLTTLTSTETCQAAGLLS